MTLAQTPLALLRERGPLGRPRISLINWEEFKRIRALIAANTWPRRWTGEEPRGDVLIPQTYRDGTRQELLLTLEGITT